MKKSISAKTLEKKILREISSGAPSYKPPAHYGRDLCERVAKSLLERGIGYDRKLGEFYNHQA